MLRIISWIIFIGKLFVAVGEIYAPIVSAWDEHKARIKELDDKKKQQEEEEEEEEPVITETIEIDPDTGKPLNRFGKGGE